MKAFTPLFLSACLCGCANFSPSIVDQSSLHAKETAAATSSMHHAGDVTQFVDPFIGTDGKGKTYPGATVPYGMVQLSPDNGRLGWDWISGYFYPDNVIAGFSHTHLSGTGAGDLYDISFMPLAGETNLRLNKDTEKAQPIVSMFSHEREQASPGYYQVYLDTYDINVELTASLRTGVQKYTYDEKYSKGKVKLDLGYSRNWDSTIATQLVMIDEYTIAGFRKSTGWASDQRVFFYTEFSQPIAKHVITVDGSISEQKHIDGKSVVAVFEFDLAHTKDVEVRTAISSVSFDNARDNLLADNVNQSFEQIRDNAKHEWQHALETIEVDASRDNKVQFYTALYHSHLAPRTFSDVNGEYKGPDGKTHKAVDHTRYSFFSLWDTFRALHPFKTITDTRHTSDMMDSLMDHYNEYGLLPVWNFQGNETDMMMGYHAVPVLADAYLKGIIDIDGEELYTAMKKSAMQDDFGIKSYKELGYVPHEEQSWNVSLTLEYAFDDWAIAQVAKKLGKDEDYAYFMDRSNNYLKHFDQESGFMRAKSSAGEFKAGFDPLAYHPEDYCEANAWQYTFFVPQDIPGLIDVYGGKDLFAAKIDEMFETNQAEGDLPEWISGFIGQYVHGNEPAHHVPYLYQYVDQGYKTQKLVRKVMDELYTTKPDGIAGNEDAGQMSAWYMFSAMGFYPVNPASGEYVLGSPEVTNAVINLESGKTFTVSTENQSATNVYVEKVLLNGQELQRPYITHQEIISGGELHFIMSGEAK